MQSQSLDFANSEALAGYRLNRFELLNWGTFHQHIWQINPKGNNALLTGDIGSGKSTLVDAITTLLVPNQKITYNKAAGAESKERNLASYVRGDYKTEKDEKSLNAKAISLRDSRSYTVLLASFYNESYDQWVTIAQVFWLKANTTTPERIFLVATKPLSIKEHFSHFGKDISDLKKRLKKTQDITLFDSFVRYSSEFRRHMGIDNEQALTLFYQTVSMKSVGNLTDFVRLQMLEAQPVQERIDAICREFENLNKAHEAVLKAKAQVALLVPMISDCDTWAEKIEEIDQLRRCREALYAYFSKIKILLLSQRIDKREQALQRLQAQLENIAQQLNELRRQESDLRHNIDDQGGRRLADIERQVIQFTQDLQRKQTLAERYQGYCNTLEWQSTIDENLFFQNRNRAEERQSTIEHQQQKLQDQEVDIAVEKQQYQQQWNQLEQELVSLRARKTNIPSRNLSIRQQICEGLSFDESTLPFVGELIQVREEDRHWQGAAERVLHNFGLSLLVPESCYNQVARYVDKTRLKGRIVYFKVNKTSSNYSLQPQANGLINKLAIKPDSEFYHWLEHELTQRFDYSCCEGLEQFRREPKAITVNGQIKSGSGRHEKDDRFSINDHSRYVLGWSNQEKIEALENQQQQIEQSGHNCIQQLKNITKQKKVLETNRDTIVRLLEIRHFNEIHWQPLATSIEALHEERRKIEEDSDILQQLQKKLRETQHNIRQHQDVELKKAQDSGSLKTKLADDKQERTQAKETLSDLPEKEQTFCFSHIHGMRADALGGKTLTAENCDKSQTELRKWLQDKIDNEASKLSSLSTRIVTQMERYKQNYPIDTREVDANLKATDEFREMLEKLQQEDLPRHEDRFKKMLNEGAIHDIALFQNILEKERHEIDEKIQKINHSLQAIDYNPGTFITLVTDRNPDPEIRQFQQDMRDCLGDALAAEQDDLYTEHKFLQVKTLIDRFSGREGVTDLDKKWTKKVTDVRNWFLFSASERWREDNTEKEHYSDSAGKSGGQKEKLAYTILASALAYQFGLEWGEQRSRSFRFVMIDEAFGRGSDESARYGLELFHKLNLQLLIVTPLQKIHIIEDYVNTVNFVHNEEGRNSLVRNLSIEEYRKEKAEHKKTQTSQSSASPSPQIDTQAPSQDNHESNLDNA